MSLFIILMKIPFLLNFEKPTYLENNGKLAFLVKGLFYPARKKSQKIT